MIRIDQTMVAEIGIWQNYPAAFRFAPDAQRSGRARRGLYLAQPAAPSAGRAR